MKVLIIGASGMLGYSLFSNLSEYEHLDVFGTVRSIEGKEAFFTELSGKLFNDVDIENLSRLEQVMHETKPDVVINCIGLIKQYDIAKGHVASVQVNALLPHQLAAICESHNAKLIHFSTDCVFSGQKGLYVEDDLPDAVDLYGSSKRLGEVSYGKHLTLRTSIIGHELNSSVSLIDWFLSQEQGVSGFSKAVFSGLPTCYVAKLLAEKILPNKELAGMYHLSVEPIDKFSLLKQVNEVYGKGTEITENASFVIDRSLNSDELRKQIDFTPPTWPELINFMHSDFKKRYVR
ncbi:dTDP-4-dehydrorhamnose reductase family protein [Grimontia sp. NTOU-MAR1]|uniref:dTDP-4-dehydrorhamnose reductase family protein n=1 Tax=Grimontia sp. NTOU-MAR1 TaxID=3111011 RepID=UPI002DBCC5A4|nr:SDR family oxidoreductase [Grimontia sp. NTOU-MAR1]WRV97523.1 SDR family oxidoreductase [Grimontia sp. NTOU-MAR1]